MTVSWGAGSSPAGLGLTYVLEVRLNNGGWSVATTTSGRSYSYTVPTNATYIQFRVKCRDTNGNESDYRTGNNLSVIQYKMPTFTGSHAIFGDTKSGRIELYGSGTLMLYFPNCTFYCVGAGGGGFACAFSNTRPGSYFELYAATGGAGGYVKSINNKITNYQSGSRFDVFVGAGGLGGTESHWGGASGIKSWSKGAEGGYTGVDGTFNGSSQFFTASGGYGGGELEDSYYSADGTDGGCGSAAGGYCGLEYESTRNLRYSYSSGTPSSDAKKNGGASPNGGMARVGISSGANNKINGTAYAGAGGCGQASVRYFRSNWSYSISSTRALAGGGNGATSSNSANGTANTGGGGGGSYSYLDLTLANGDDVDIKAINFCKTSGGTGGSGLVVVTWNN